MNILEEVSFCIKALVDSDARFRVITRLGFNNTMDDEEFIRKKYKAFMGKTLNLDNPQTFNEKLQWLKLHDRKDIYTTMVDKYLVKKYVADIIGEEYIIPTIGVWDRVEDIEFDKLPQQFVLKTNHDSGGIVIVKDKAKVNFSKAKKTLIKSMKRDFFLYGREWPYKNVKRKIIAEPYLEDSVNHELRDYKFFCFNGNPKALFIATDRQTPGEDTKFDFFDMSGNHLPFINGHPNAKQSPMLPKNFDKMQQLAAKLSQNIPHVRVDFYEIDGKIKFGELTFYHYSGIVPFEPEEWDYKFGSWIDLSKVLI